MFPPGCRRLATTPAATASPIYKMTIGIAVVARVSIPRQSRGLYFKSRSKRPFGVADAAPVEVSRSQRLSGPLTRPRIVWAT
jgi:hypothetical protein